MTTANGMAPAGDDLMWRTEEDNKIQTHNLKDQSSIFVVHNKDHETILEITDDSFIFKGVEINDAGEARKAFISAMEILQNGK